MINLAIIFLLSSTFTLVSVKKAYLVSVKKAYPKDPHSYSQPDLIKTTHMHWEFEVHFDNKILDGFVILTLKKISSEARTLILDGKSLTIKKVVDANTNDKLEYVYDKR